MGNKGIHWGLIILILILVAGFHLFKPIHIEGEFTPSDLLPADWDKQNGFYLLLAMTEPPTVDFQADIIRDEYIKLLRDPSQSKNLDRRINQNIKNHWQMDKRGMVWVQYNLPLAKNLSEVREKKGEIIPKIGKYQVLLDRFEVLIRQDKMVDCLPLGNYWILPEIMTAYIPRLYLYRCLMDIENQGDYPTHVKKIIQYLKYAKKLLKTGRGAYTEYTYRVMVDYFQILAGIMQEDGCPPSVYRIVLGEVPSFQAYEVGIKNSLIYSYLDFKGFITRYKFSHQIIFPRKKVLDLFLYVKRITILTRQEFPFKNLQVLYNLEQYWDNLYSRWNKLRYARRLIAPADLALASVLRPFKVPVLSHLVRIIADYKQHYQPDFRDEEIFEKLATYQKFLDPFTGRTYVINRNQGTIGSPGPNGLVLRKRSITSPSPQYLSLNYRQP